jgi:hypothetical protein
MSGAIPLLLLYAYMAWKRINFPFPPLFIMCYLFWECKKIGKIKILEIETDEDIILIVVFPCISISINSFFSNKCTLY